MTVASPMRVVLLAGRLDRPVSGTYAADLARSLRGSGHEVFLLLSELPGTGEAEGLPARLWRHLGAWTAGASMRAFLTGELEAFRPALVHATDPTLGASAREIARRLGVPGLVTVHATGARGWTALDLEGLHLIAGGAAFADDLAGRLGIRRETVSVVPPGVRVLPGRLPEPQASGRVPVVGAAGPLEYAEGHRFLLDAVRRLLDDGRELQALVVGSGSEKPALRRRAAELRLSDIVTFAQETTRPREIIEVMDVFVEPTTREALSPMTLEAMAAGKPVVSTDARDALDAARDGVTALVVAKGDAGALADAIGRLLLEPALAVRLAREARELVRRDFSVETMARRTMDVYRALLVPPRPHSA